MNKKMSPHIIAVGAWVIFIVLGLACASTPTVPKEKQEEIKRLAESKDPGMFSQPPLAGETVLGTYQSSITITGNHTLSLQEAQAYNSTKILPNRIKKSEFNPREAAALLMIRASGEFPDIDINDLEVRSMQRTSSLFNDKTSLNPYPIPFSNPNEYTLLTEEYFSFKGLVVQRAKNTPSASDNTIPSVDTGKVIEEAENAETNIDFKE